MSLPEGLYVIQPVSSDSGLAIGPVPLIYPPPTVPVRVLNGWMVDQWRLVRKDGGYAITDRNPNGGYTVIRKENDVFVGYSDQGFPKAWSIEPAGPQIFVIKEASEDAVFTLQEDGFPQLTLQPANGSDHQKFKFTRIDE